MSFVSASHGMRVQPRGGTPRLTVFTPTYDRAHVLDRVFDSLLRQTTLDFEWLIVDDGSTDGTRELVGGWLGQAPFAIRYFHQENSGKHVADNRAVAEARGPLIATVDSDDRYVPRAVERFLEIWDSIPNSRRGSFSSGVALCAHPDGELIGTAFPEDVFDTTYAELRTMHRVTGDKTGFARVDVLRRFPFPVFPGERLVPEGIQYARMGRHYRMRCVNEVLKIVDYQPGGLSDRMSELLQENPRTAMLLEHELLLDGGETWYRRFRGHAQLTRYALHTGRPVEGLRMGPSKALAALGAPAGVALYTRDRIRRRPAAEHQQEHLTR